MQTTRHECSSCGCSTTAPAPTELQVARSRFIKYWDALVSFTLLAAGLILDYILQTDWFTGTVRFSWYLAAYLPVAVPVFAQAYTQLRKGNVFTEFFLMGIATLGAFYIGEYPEGVAVMLFYAVGEAFQQRAVQKARSNISALLDVRSETAHLLENNQIRTVHPNTVAIGEIIRVKPGERVPLDGTLLGDERQFNTAALTGESRPRTVHSGETVLAGSVNLQELTDIRVTKSYENSSISRILQLVQEAASRKARTEQFIRSFARVYTPVVVLLASLVVLLPWFFVEMYLFEDWLYRGLVFLVISCPCALVISIPLGYFGGIGAASRNGILVKGSNYLDALHQVDTVVFDKTGTLTKGTFAVRKAHIHSEDFSYLLAVERGSNHPVARAILTYAQQQQIADEAGFTVTNQQELSGKGIKAMVNGKLVLAGNRALLTDYSIAVPPEPADSNETTVHLSIDARYAGRIGVADELKDDAAATITRLRRLGVKRIVMLSGDVASVAEKTGKLLGLDQVFGNLLPEDKSKKLEEIIAGTTGKVAYVGDGINDAPVLARSDVGIAMGALGSDAAIETADVVIQTDEPSRVATAIQISRATRAIVWQNITLALGVKILVMILGTLGMASLWEAVFADVGVALLAILNAVRIQTKSFE